MKKYQITKLNNGLTLITEHRPGLNSVYLELAVKVGSRYETSQNNGISHLTEHLLEKKAISSLKKHDWLKHYFNENFNAYSMTDRTNYELTCHKKDLDLGVKFLAELTRPVSFSQKQINQEIEVISEELLEYKETPFYYLDQEFKKKYYQKNPLRFEILGRPSILKKFKPIDLENFIKKYYAPDNLVVTVFGDISQTKIKQLVSQYFKKSAKTIIDRNEIVNYKYPGDDLILLNKQQSQTQFSWHFPILNQDAKTNVKWEFFVEILNNYLFYTSREKMFTYSFSTDIRTYQEFFDFYIESVFRPDKTVEFYSFLNKALRDFKKTFSAKDLTYYKNKKTIILEIDNDDKIKAANILRWYAQHYGSANALSLLEQEKIINSISLSEIKKYFTELFSQNQGTVVIVGPINNKQKKTITNIWQNWKI
ncbi:MAG: hypothetical protein GF365_04145 [Candidatus Buchananbacteria bacterium]|nr:hypothetical protein [Candidatus Buchananbacteria bacterium]